MHHLLRSLLFILVPFIGMAQTPSLQPSSPQICEGEVVRLTATGCAGTVVWMNGKTGVTLVDTLRKTTTYTAICQQGSTTLFSFPSSTVTALPKPDMPYLFCNAEVIKLGQSTTITTFGCNGTIRWSSGEIGRTITVSPSKTTTYTAICINEAGCSSEPISRTIIVEDPANPPQPPVTVWKYGCQDEAILLKASGCTEGVYVWYKNTFFGDNVVKSEEVGRGNSQEVTMGGSDVFYTARCQVENCLGDESNRLFIGRLTQLPAPVVQKELLLPPNGTVDLATALGAKQSAGGVYEFRTSADLTTPLLADPAKVAAIGTYYVVERSRLGKCVSPVATIYVRAGTAALEQPTAAAVAVREEAPTASVTEKLTVSNLPPLKEQVTETGAVLTARTDATNLDELEFPQAFSPNNDGVNDAFVIRKLGTAKAALRVYNRFGHVVYETDHYRNDWQGTANVGAAANSHFGLPDGTYYYLLQLADGRQRLSFVTIAR